MRGCYLAVFIWSTVGHQQMFGFGVSILYHVMYHCSLDYVVSALVGVLYVGIRWKRVLSIILVLPHTFGVWGRMEYGVK